MSEVEELRGFRDTFFQYLRNMWWPDIDDTKLPSLDRQLELFRRVYLRKNEEGQAIIKCSLDQLNSILTECYQPSVRIAFFNYFFPCFADGITLGDFMKGVFKFMKVALWIFGNFENGLIELGRSENICEEIKDVPFDNICPITENSFLNRTPFDFIKNLNAEERHLLGYATDKTGIDVDMKERFQRIGEQNTKDYLTLDTLDVYIATSMRELDEFESFVRFVDGVFAHSDLKVLNLRYFDPTLAFCKNRITKGLLEALMLKRAKLTLYVAGENDTFGKDSECAATLIQGKPVVVYIEKGTGEKGSKLDTRARIFKEIHPLGLQVVHESGVANGVIVTRTLEECRDVVKDLLLHKLKVRIDKQSDAGYILKEDRTESVLRVATDDALLTRAFGNFYSKES